MFISPPSLLRLSAQLPKIRRPARDYSHIRLAGKRRRGKKLVLPLPGHPKI
jgi:hypothetical protein